MTACVNKHSKRVAAVISASLVGALSLGVAVPAFAENVDMQAEQATPEWDGVDFAWSGTYDSVNGYWTTPAGEPFTLESAAAANGDPISLSDLTVVYVSGVGSTINWETGNADSTQKVYTEAPTNASDYHALVFNGKPWIWSGHTKLSDLQNWFTKKQVKDVYVKVDKKSVDGAKAIENGDVNDTSFMYTGDKKNVGFRDAAGNLLVAGTDYKLTSIVKVGDSTNTNYANISIFDAGDYIATIEGQGAYEGTEQVKFTVAPIDLAKDTITIDTMEPPFKGSSNKNPNNDLFTFRVNGEKVNYNIFMIDTESVTGYNGVDWTNNYGWNDPAKVTVQVHANKKWDDTTKGGGKYNPANFVNPDYSEATANVLVVGQLINFYFYDNAQLFDTTTPEDGVLDLTIDASKGESFDPAKVTCAEGVGLKSLSRTVTVYRDGEETDDYSTPGVLTVQVDVTAPNDLSYGGSKTIKVNIVGKHYADQPKAYVSIDGKDVNKIDGVEYDGEAVEPSITVKVGSAVVDAADYTVTYTDKDGNAVEGDIVEPGTYTGTISFGNATYGINGGNNKVQDIEFTFEVTKATVHSAKADQDFYAVTGEAVTPKFTAYTGEDLDGLSVEIDPATAGVTYYKAVQKTWTGNPFDSSDDVTYWVTTGDPIKASDLKKAGNYIAVLNVPADDPHFQGSIPSQMFEIGEYAVFSDVAADAWYAENVYNANDLGYMTGIKGTDLFMPLADISRAELSQVFFNMAGNASDTEKYYPTAFGDVDGWAWYAQPVAWASEAGIVTGYDADTFGPMDKATREQVAVMLYRYAKAQGKDVSVSDVDGALAKYKDGDQVSDWAREAMAWSVENDIFGQNTDELWAKQNIQRAAVATIAVRFQPEALPEA